MTKFMPVLKMQIYFLSVAWCKKALEGLHLHLLLLEWVGGVWWGKGGEQGGGEKGGKRILS